MFFLANGAVHDAAGNPNVESALFQHNYDFCSPAVVSISPLSMREEIFWVNPVSMQLLWSKPVASFSPSDVHVDGASIIEWIETSQQEYS